MKRAVFFLLLTVGGLGCSPETYYRVEGDSMLPTLHGEMRECVCPYCGFKGYVSAQKTAVCANCLGVIPESRLSQASRIPGEVLTVVACPEYNYDDVVIVHPEGKPPCVKRVVGLPGDTVEIAHGNVLVNGHRRVRSLEQWKRMRILVHDDPFRPNGVSRWVSCDGWQSEKEGWRVSTKGAHLVYHHAEGRLETTFADGEKNTTCRFYPSPITNRQAGNGTELRSDWTFAIRELLLEISISEVSGVGTLEIRLPMGEEGCTFTVAAKKGESLFSTLDGVPQSSENVSIKRWKIPENATPDILFPQIQWNGTGSVQLARLSLFRGEYVLPDKRISMNFPKFGSPTLAKEANTGYYLLGDNSLPSDDSRKWGDLPVERIRGKVIPPSLKK